LSALRQRNFQIPEGRNSVGFIVILPIEPRSDVGEAVSIKCSQYDFLRASLRARSRFLNSPPGRFIKVGLIAIRAARIDRKIVGDC